MSTSTSNATLPPLNDLVPLYISDPTIPKQDSEWHPEKLNLTYVKYLQRGSTADILAVRQEKKEGLFAVKVIYKDHDPQGRPLNESQKSRTVLFTKQEACLLMPLRHDHIVRCFGAYETPSAYILVFQFAKGGDMYTLINNGRFPEEVAIHYIRQLTGAVTYLHEKRIIHRDLKPENILIKNSKKRPIPTTDDSILLCDFGMSVWDSRKEVAIPTGTVEYAAPDTYLAGFDKPVDIWSIG
ncbi:kinase-like protein [Fomitiporia mediterranea MF3/22]|uniref:kinase-like protein n=1 Tax=Fomitiporia mediterranea (strain MF3/22) TaxID=694068 RepID=UPI00044097EE|nr:kinase-like protein [Fomitiporia mediterranea MF3/22]EJD04709.1 kinase-like protein [Fomitiporia mediterranea MF3/22]